MAANRGAIDHVLPVIGQSKLDKRFKQGVPDALFRPAPETDIDRIPFAVSLMHVAPGATHPKDMQHAIHISPIVMRGPRFTPTFGGYSPSMIRHSISVRSPRAKIAS